MAKRNHAADPRPQRTGEALPSVGRQFADQSWALALALVLITFVAYTPVWRAGFIFDDTDLLLKNPMVKASDGLYRIWFTTEAPDYWPLTSTAWWLEWRAWGDNAVGYHAVNLLLHTVNVVLLWLVLRRLKIPGAWLAGLVFAIHPVNVATVAWVSEQKNTLSMLFYLLAIRLYLRFDEEAQPFAAKGWGWYGLSLAAFLLALLSKTAVVMLPLVLLGCVWWRRGGIRGKDVMRSIPFFACSLILGLVTVWFQSHRAMGGTTIRTDSFLSRLVAAGWVPWFYLYEVFLPFNLTVIYPQWHIDASRWISYIPGMALVGCFALFWWKRETWGRPWLFALGYFVIMLFPVLGFFDQSFFCYSFVADHWQYYSIVGVIASVVAAGDRLCRSMDERGRNVGALASVAVLVTLGAATWTRANVYKGEETLWRDNVAKNPNAWVAHYNLGNVLAEQGKAQEAVEHYEQAVRIKPDYTDAHHNLGNALRAVGRVQDAIGQYEEALRIRPDYADAHYNLALAFRQVGKLDEEIHHYERAVQIKPDFAMAHYNLGNALVQAGRVQDGIGHYEQALRIQPDYAEAHNNLAAVLLETGKIQEGIAHCEQALRIKPDYAEAHYNLAVLLGKAGKVDEAIAHLQTAVRLEPGREEFRRKLDELQPARARTEPR